MYFWAHVHILPGVWYSLPVNNLSHLVTAAGDRLTWPLPILLPDFSFCALFSSLLWVKFGVLFLAHFGGYCCEVSCNALMLYLWRFLPVTNSLHRNHWPQNVNFENIDICPQGAPGKLCPLPAQEVVSLILYTLGIFVFKRVFQLGAFLLVRFFFFSNATCCLPWHMWAERTTLWSWFCLSTFLWVLGIKLVMSLHSSVPSPCPCFLVFFFFFFF